MVRRRSAPVWTKGEEEPRQTLRDLVEAVVVHEPGPDRTIVIEIRGQLASLVGEDVFPNGQVRGERW